MRRDATKNLGEPSAEEEDSCKYGLAWAEEFILSTEQITQITPITMTVSIPSLGLTRPGELAVGTAVLYVAQSDFCIAWNCRGNVIRYNRRKLENIQNDLYPVEKTGKASTTLGLWDSWLTRSGVPTGQWAQERSCMRANQDKHWKKFMAPTRTEHTSASKRNPM